MDGFRDRMSGRYERNGQATTGTTPSRTFERPVRNTVSEGVSVEEINGIINKSNQEQINVLAEYFDEAKADRMESERAIIEALSCKMADMLASSQPSMPQEPVVENTYEPAPVPAEPSFDSEQLGRIERLVGQNAESLSENEEIAGRTIEYLRAQSEMLNELRSSVEGIRDNQNSYAAPVVAPVAAPMPDMSEITVDFSQEKEEILSAVGDNRALLNMIRQDVLNSLAKPAQESDEEQEEKEEVELLSKELGEKHFGDLEELVHSECVKVFKNLKKTFEEENEKTVKETSKAISSMRLFLVSSLALNAVTVIILVLQFLGIF